MCRIIKLKTRKYLCHIHKSTSEVCSRFFTFALHSWSEHTDSTGIHCRLHVEPSREVRHILATVADGERVWARVERDVCDCVCPISIVLYVNLGLSAAVWDDLNGQISWASIGTVHNEFPFLPDLGALQAWARAAYLTGQDRRDRDKQLMPWSASATKLLSN